MSDTTLTVIQLESALFQAFIDAAKEFASTEIEGEEEDPTIYIATVVQAARRFADVTEGVATSMGITV